MSAAECTAYLDFGVSPYLEIQCTLPPGHPGQHSARTAVMVDSLPYRERTYDGLMSRFERPRARVFLSWTEPANADT